ncbi:hypothetical protein [Lysobacter gummosus]
MTPRELHRCPSVPTLSTHSPPPWRSRCAPPVPHPPPAASI